MRTALLAVTLLAAMHGTVIAQSQALKVNISEGRSRAGLAAVQTPYATGGTEGETQIASFAIQPGESREVAATSKYGARPVTVSAAF